MRSNSMCQILDKKVLIVLVLCNFQAVAGNSVPSPAVQKRHEGTGAVKVAYDGGAYGYSVNFADAGVTQFDRISANSYSLGDGGKLNSLTYSLADITLYVNVDGGSDLFDCTDAGAPCITIQGALNKLPKSLKYRETVNIAPGSYTCFIVSGFSQDQSDQQSTGGLLLNGTMVTSTISTGSTSGLATGGTIGFQEVFGTLVKSGESWTTNDLRGRYINILSGTNVGQIGLISSNSNDTITIEGAWSFAPDNTTSFIIQDPGTLLTTPIKTIPTALISPVNVTSCLSILSNSFINGGINISNMTVATNTTGVPVNILSGSAPSFSNFKITNTTGTTRFQHFGTGQLNLTNVYSFLPDPTPGIGVGIHLNLVSPSASSFILRSLFVNGHEGIGSDLGTFTFQSSELLNIERGFRIDYSASAFLISDRLDTFSWAVNVGDRHDGATASGSALLENGIYFGPHCHIGVEQGGGFLWLQSASGVCDTAVLQVRGGGTATITNGSVTATGTISDYTLSNQGLTGYFSDIDYPNCVTALTDRSSICKN